MRIGSFLGKITIFSLMVFIVSNTSSKQVFAFSFSDNLKAAFLSAYQEPLVQTVAEGSGAEAKDFIDKMGKRAISFLGNDRMTQTQKEAEFRKLLKSNFDLRTIGRFVMGRNWKVASEAQRNEYQRLFEDLVVKVYAARFDEYQGQNFDVSSFRAAGKKDYLVTSYITSETGPKVQVDWRVRKKDGRYRIIDIIIEGVSMSVTQRSDFASVIQRGGGDVEVLLAHLRK